MKLKSSVLIGSMVLALCCSRAWAQDGSDELLKHEIKTTWGIDVVDTDLSEKIVPLVTTPDVNITMEDVEPEDETACLQTVVHALNEYPAAFVSSLVSKIALAEDIRAWGIRGGGIYGPSLFGVNCVDAEDNRQFDIISVHNQIAALVLAKYSPDLASWDHLNPPSFHYGNMADVQNELRNPDSRQGTAILLANGFVAPLGTTNIKNDFDTFAGEVFGDTNSFVPSLKQYPPLRGKTRLLMSIYLQKAPTLKTFFDQSGLTDAAAN